MLAVPTPQPPIDNHEEEGRFEEEQIGAEDETSLSDDDYIKDLILDNEKKPIPEPKLSRKRYQISSSLIRHVISTTDGKVKSVLYTTTKKIHEGQGCMSEVRLNVTAYQLINNLLQKHQCKNIEKIITRACDENGKYHKDPERFRKTVCKERNITSVFFDNVPEVTFTLDGEGKPKKGYILMPYVGEYDLLTYINSNPIVSLSNNYKIISNLIYEVMKRHIIAIAHGDITLKNFRIDNELSIWLIDHGLSFVLTGEPQTNYPRTGAKGYAAPELYSLNKKSSGAERDIFSLALVILQLYRINIQQLRTEVNGETQFHFDHFKNIYSDHLNRIFTPSTANKLILLISEMLSEKPQHRPGINTVKSRFIDCHPTELDILKYKIYYLDNMVLKLYDLFRDENSMLAPPNMNSTLKGLHQLTKDLSGKCNKTFDACESAPEVKQLVVSIHNEMVAIFQNPCLIQTRVPQLTESQAKLINVTTATQPSNLAEYFGAAINKIGFNKLQEYVPVKSGISYKNSFPTA